MSTSPISVLFDKVDLFAAIGEPQRLAIVADLAVSGSRMTVGEIADGLPIDTSVVSRHLKILREAGAVRSQRQGRQVLHWVDYGELSGLLRHLADAIESCCPAGDEIPT